ncbi:MAG: hypothetical protein NZ929_00065 [Aigarchaeota archaeon]|nr:hypothetical protein [Aigarchaeota archaeon]
MPIQGIEWIIIPFIAVLILIIVAIRYPTLRVGFGAALAVLGTLLFPIPLIGPFLGGASLVIGIFLLAWGVATLSSKRERSHILRICPGCGRDISSFPDDIKRCPYCGRELT